MTTTNEVFPFQLEDIQAWVIQRKDGTVIRYNYMSPSALITKGEVKRSGPAQRPYSGFSDWCNHTPHVTNPPIFTNGNVNLYIADAIGARKVEEEFDVCIDGGNVLTVSGEFDLPNIYGDQKFSSLLTSHVFRSTSGGSSKQPNRVIKLRWADRCPPPVYPSFWPALNEELNRLGAAKVKKGEGPLNVLTICQGGHGRSGSALVLLMMCMTSYTPLDALTHIRALHCARAIESKEQHVYLNLVAKELGRTENALEAEGVKSFKDRFLAEDIYSEDLKSRVRSNKGAGDRTRDAGYL